MAALFLLKRFEKNQTTEKTNKQRIKKETNNRKTKQITKDSKNRTTLPKYNTNANFRMGLNGGAFFAQKIFLFLSQRGNSKPAARRLWNFLQRSGAQLSEGRAPLGAMGAWLNRRNLSNITALCSTGGFKGPPVDKNHERYRMSKYLSPSANAGSFGIIGWNICYFYRKSTRYN